jgi:hypothetical protein
VILRARDADDAIARAEEEAVRYVTEADEGMEYLGSVDVYEMFDDVGDGAEVYSLLRSTPLAPTAFLDRYHNQDGTHSRPSRGERDSAS